MSRSSRTGASSSSLPPAPHSHPDRDVVMGPPPLPPQVSASGSGSGDSKARDKETLELAEKYKKLKRKYFELEEVRSREACGGLPVSVEPDSVVVHAQKHRDVTTELRGSGERSVKLRTERAYLLERISELETMIQQPHAYAGYPQQQPTPFSSAYPRSLLNPAAQKRFVGNLDRAMNEAEKEDHNVDPLLQSKHVGPNARKRLEAEQKERQEEEQREAKKGVRQPRKPRNLKEKEKEKEIPLAASSSANQAGPSGERASTRASERERERVEEQREAAATATEQADRMDRDREETGPPLSLAPASTSHRDLEMHDADSPPSPQAPVHLDTSGQRLRVKSPALPTPPYETQQARPPSPLPVSTFTSTPPPPPTPSQQEIHHQTPREPEHDEEPRRSPIVNRFDPRDDQYHPPERDDMDVDRDPQPTISSLPQEPPRPLTHSQPPPPSLSQLTPQLHSPPPPQPSPTTTDAHMSSRSSPETRLAPTEPATTPTPPTTSPPIPSPRSLATPTPSSSMPAPVRSSSRASRKRSDSPAVHSPGETNWVPPGAPSSAQAAMMGQLVLSPPSPYRLTPVDPVPLKPAMQMTFRTSPATHVSQYGHTGSTGSNGTTATNQQQGPRASASPKAQREVNIDPQLYRASGVTTPGAHGGEHMISFAANGSGSTGSSLSGTPTSGIGGFAGLAMLGPPPPPILLQTPLNTPTPSAGPGGSRGKPKRLKAHTVTSKNYSIPMVPRDKVGKPMLPLNVGIMTVLSLGTVCTREHFHTERYIFPVGYEVTRRYLSTVDPNNEAVYHCTILDGGDGPKFQIVASDDPDKPVIAGTATGAWSAVVRSANYIRNRQHSNSVSGPDFFGLGQNTIKHLIQELPDADLLQNYVWQNFVEGGPLGGRHAAVIPALPEERDAGDGENHFNGGTMGLMSMTPAPTSPQPSFFSGKVEDGKGELQIVQEGSPSQSGSAVTSPTLPAAERSSSMKPLTFQQEFPQRYNKDHRSRDDAPIERRGSASSSHTNEDYERRNSQGSSQPWKSPVQQREPLSPREHRSPYQALSAPLQSPPVPATFASIMHAYSTSPMSPSGPAASDGYHAENGTTRSRNGSHSHAP